MGILDSLKMKKQVRAAYKDAQVYAESLMSLSVKIFKTAYNCTEACKEIIEQRYGKDSRESSFMFLRVCYEYLFFILHVADRLVLANHGPEARARFMDELFPLLQIGSTQAFCGHWPSEIKERVSVDFVTNINSANRDYAECKSIYDDKAPLAVSSVVGKLGHRIAEVLSIHELELSVVSTTTGMDALLVLDLKKAVGDICKSA